MDNDQMNEAIEETLRRVQGLSDATVAGGKKMDSAFVTTADGIRQAISQIGQAVDIHEAKLGELTGQYVQLSDKIGAAMASGRTDEARAIRETRNAISGEIAVREKAVEEAKALAAELEKEAQKREQSTKQIEANAQAHQTLRGRIRALKEEMALYREAHGDQTEEYRRMSAELGRLSDIQGDISTQAKILSNDQAKFQGFIQGVSGLSGAFSAATGAVSLFAGENENLQRVMTKVQSVMAIAMGLQSVSQTLNKDSAFQLVTLNGLKEWWAGIVAKSTAAEVAETTATVANTAARQAQTAATVQGTVAQGANAVAQGAQTTAAATGTVANLTLAGAFRAVGLAIKSIPVFGWLLAGLSAIVAISTHFASKVREARKAQEEFTKAMIEGAYKPIGKLEELSAKYTALGNNIKEKEQFIKDNRKAFDDLGVAVTNVRDAENLLIDNKDAFISAQIAKAKAMVLAQNASEKIKKQMELQAEVEKMPDRVTVAMTGGSAMGGYTTSTLNNTIKEKKRKEIEELQKEIREDFKRAAEEEANEYNKLKKAGIKSAGTYAQGTIGAIEKAIAEKQESLKHLKPNTTEWKKANKEIEALQKQIEKPTRKHAGSSKKEKDPFVEKLEKRKEEYERYKKWLNSGDDVLIKSASVEFKGLIAQGATYIDFLKKQRDEILSIDAGERTKEQNKNLRALNDRISEETKKTVLEAFNEELSKQLGNAKTTLEMLNIIARKRKELADDDSELGSDKKKTLDDAEVNAVQKQQEETKKLLEDYASYLDKKIQLDLEYNNDLALLERARAKATTDEERKKIDAAIANRAKQYAKDSKTSGDSDFDQLLQTYRTFEEKKDAIIEEFNEKRARALEHGNTELVERLNKAQNEALSRLAIDEMKLSPDWEKVFGDLDEVGNKELERLLASIEGKTAILGVELSPADFKAIQDKVKELKDEIRERNPFKALAKSFGDLKKATTDGEATAALSSMFDSAAKSGQQLKGIISDVTSTLEDLGVEGTEEVGHVIQALEGLAEGAQNAVMGIVSGNPVQVVSGAIKAVSSVVKYFTGANDRRAERSIKRHQENVAGLTSAYKELEWQISKALSGSKYKHQQAAIDNMKQQQKELQGMIAAEGSKKKKDNGKVNEWKEQIKEIDRTIADTIESMNKSLLDTDVKSVASQLGDAIVGAFESGKDAAAAWGESVKGIVNNVVKNLLIQKVLQEPIDKIISKYTSKWVGKDGAFVGFDAVVSDVSSLSSELTGLYPQLEQAVGALKNKLNITAAETDTSLTGAVKGVTEETASIVAGQMNAMRINQVEASAILRQQLTALNAIVQNTSYNRMLVEIHKELRAMNGGADPLRSQGLA
nr:MAG TPA: chromosome segregation ATPase [Caudoviricetes sp.]